MSGEGAEGTERAASVRGHKRQRLAGDEEGGRGESPANHFTATTTEEDEFEDDAFGRVSEAIVRVIASALIDRAASSRTSNGGDGGNDHGNDGNGDTADGGDDDVYAQWVNPTEAIVPHPDNMRMLRASLAAYGGRAQEPDDGGACGGGGGHCPKVDESDLIAVLLEPRAVRAATSRLLRRVVGGD